MPKCVECGGRKEVPCTGCRAPVGRQTKNCEWCKRKGQMKCPACGGTGRAGPGVALSTRTGVRQEGTGMESAACR